jgi:hypothetical protein
MHAKPVAKNKQSGIQRSSAYNLNLSMNPNKPFISTNLLPLRSRYLSTAVTNVDSVAWLPIVREAISSEGCQLEQNRRGDDSPYLAEPRTSERAFSPSNMCR